MNLDVKALMLTLLAAQREYVGVDLESYSCAMAVMFLDDGKSFIDFPKFDDEPGKIAAYVRFVEAAKRQKAVLIVTVNHNFSRTKGADASRGGEFDETNSRRSIILTASGPGLNASGLQQNYVIIDNQVRFDDPDWLENVEVSLLPGWPESSSSRCNN